MSTNNEKRLFREAVDRAKVAVSKLPHNNDLFQQCVGDACSVDTVLATLREKATAHRRKRSTKALEGFYNYTSWLMNMARSMDVAVNSSAGIACPVWASVKFILIISQENAYATEKILRVLRMIADNMPGLDLYQQFHEDMQFQVALVNLFTDITEFSVHAYRYFSRKALVRLSLLVRRSFDDELGGLVSDIERRTRIVDSTATALHQQRIERRMNEAQAQKSRADRTGAIQWLQSANTREYHDRNVASIVEGTCKWILTHPKFHIWSTAECRETSERFLIIHGRAGCGKTILSSYIYRTLITAQERRLSARETLRTDERHAIPLLFSFSAAERRRQTAASAARTLLAQILETDHCDVAISQVIKLMAQSSVSTSEIFSALGHATQSLPDPIKLIIDGIDECSDSAVELLQHLFMLVDSDAHLRILVLGQTHCFTDFLGLRSEFPSLCITPTTNHEDITTVIQAGMKRCPKYWSPSTSEMVTRSLLENADGMLLWVRLMVDYLRSASSESEIRECLRELPDGLEHTFCLLLDRLYSKLQANQRRTVQKLLSIITICGRSLSPEELRMVYAVAIEPESFWNFQKARSSMLQLTEDEIIHLCGGFVTYFEGHFHLVHSSARDFLISPAPQWSTGMNTHRNVFSVSLAESHGMLSNVCFQIFQDKLTSDVAYEEQVEYPIDGSRATLMRYASLHILYHLKRSGKDTTQLRSSYCRLLESGNYLKTLKELTSDETVDAEFQQFPDFESNLEALRSVMSMIEGGWNPEPKTEIDTDVTDPPLESHAHVTLSTREHSTSLTCNYSGDALYNSSGSSHAAYKDLDQSGLSNSSIGGRPRTPVHTPSFNETESSTGTSQDADPAALPTNEEMLGSLIGVQRRLYRPSATPFMHVSSHFNFSLVFIKRLLLGTSTLNPLENFWQRVIQASDSMSPMVMSGITWYCYKMGRMKEVFEIGVRCCDKLQNADTVLRLLHEGLMSDIFAHKEEYPQAIEHLEWTRRALLKPSRKHLPSRYLRKALLLLVDYYLRVQNYRQAQDIVHIILEQHLKELSYEEQLQLYCDSGECYYGLHESGSAVEEFHKLRKLYKLHSSHPDHSRAIYIDSLLLLARCKEYECTEALLLPETWNDVKAKYLCGLELPCHARWMVLV